MLKKVGTVAALAGTFMFATAFQSPAHADTFDNYSYKSYDSMNQNGFIHRYEHSHHFRWIMDQQLNQGWGQTDSGSSNHGTAGSSQTNTGSSNPGTAGSGQTNTGSSNPGTAGSGQTNTGSSNPGTAGSGQTNTGSSIPGTAGSGQTNTGSSSPGTAGSGQTNTGSSNQQGTYQLSQFEQQVVQLTNQERTSRGLKPLQIDLRLSQMARDKSQDMANNHYFSHQSPTYGSPFDMMKQYGISYSYAGENIAEGQTTPQEVVNAWMNSAGHRANILNANYTKIGVGYVANGNIWTQDFIG